MLIDIEIQSKKANFTIRVKVGFVLTEYIWYKGRGQISRLLKDRDKHFLKGKKVEVVLYSREKSAQLAETNKFSCKSKVLFSRNSNTAKYIEKVPHTLDE